MANQPKLENGLTKVQNAFIDAYISNGGRKEKAAIQAGYSETCARTRACELLKREDIQRQIVDRSTKLMASHVPKALETIANLAVNARSESVKLAAAQDLLNRAGIKGAQDHQPNQQLTTREQYNSILDEIKRALMEHERIIDIEPINEKSLEYRNLDS